MISVTEMVRVSKSIHNQCNKLFGRQTGLFVHSLCMMLNILSQLVKIKSYINDVKCKEPLKTVSTKSSSEF